MSDGEQRKKSNKTVLILVAVILLLAFAAIVVMPKEGGDVYQVKDQGGGITANAQESRAVETQPEKRSEIELSTYEKAIEEQKELKELSPSEVVEAFWLAIIQKDAEEASRHTNYPINRGVMENPIFQEVNHIEILGESLNENGYSANVDFKIIYENSKTRNVGYYLRNDFGYWRIENF